MPHWKRSQGYYSKCVVQCLWRNQQWQKLEEGYRKPKLVGVTEWSSLAFTLIPKAANRVKLRLIPLCFDSVFSVPCPLTVARVIRPRVPCLPFGLFLDPPILSLSGSRTMTSRFIWPGMWNSSPIAPSRPARCSLFSQLTGQRRRRPTAVQILSKRTVCHCYLSAHELCEGRGGRPWLHVPNRPSQKTTPVSYTHLTLPTIDDV